jgi:uncharacterized protein (TIGR02270 family)
MPHKAPVPPVILWDILEEHFQEAAFLWTQRERSLRAPDLSLADVAEGDEHRLVAHVEGLLHGGARIAERLLLPALKEGMPGEVAVAALTLLASDERDWSGTVLAALPETQSPEPLLRGAGLSPRSSFESALRECLPRLTPSLQAQALATLAIRHADAGPFLASLRAHDEPALLAAAARAARFTDRATALAVVDRGLAHEHPEVRNAAIATGCILGHRKAWLRCHGLLEQGEPLPRQALLTVAAGGTAADVQVLRGLLSQPEQREEALWALGFNGGAEAIEAAMALLREGEPAAAESLAFISGLPLVKCLEPRAEEEEGEEAQEPTGADEDAATLPGPAKLKGEVRLEALEGWWKNSRPRRPDMGRYLLGRPWSFEVLLAALEEAPMRRRHGLAWELSVRTRGTCRVEPGAWTWQQLLQVRSVKHTAPRFQSGPFAHFLSA